MNLTRKLTNFEYRQLLHLHLEGEYLWKNPKTGKKWNSNTWKKMIDVLSENDLIDSHAYITRKGESVLAEWAEIHQ